MGQEKWTFPNWWRRTSIWTLASTLHSINTVTLHKDSKDTEQKDRDQHHKQLILSETNSLHLLFTNKWIETCRNTDRLHNVILFIRFSVSAVNQQELKILHENPEEVLLHSLWFPESYCKVLQWNIPLTSTVWYPPLLRWAILVVIRDLDRTLYLLCRRKHLLKVNWLDIVFGLHNNGKKQGNSLRNETIWKCRATLLYWEGLFDSIPPRKHEECFEANLDEIVSKDLYPLRPTELQPLFLSLKDGWLWVIEQLSVRWSVVVHSKDNKRETVWLVDRIVSPRDEWTLELTTSSFRSDPTSLLTCVYLWVDCSEIRAFRQLEVDYLQREDSLKWFFVSFQFQAIGWLNWCIGWRRSWMFWIRRQFVFVRLHWSVHSLWGTGRRSFRCHSQWHPIMGVLNNGIQVTSNHPMRFER